VFTYCGRRKKRERRSGHLKEKAEGDVNRRKKEKGDEVNVENEVFEKKTREGRAGSGFFKKKERERRSLRRKGGERGLAKITGLSFRRTEGPMVLYPSMWGMVGKELQIGGTKLCGGKKKEKKEERT